MTARWIEEELERLETAGLRRRRVDAWACGGPELLDSTGRRFLNLSSNDYLSLSGVGPTEVLIGAGASPLVTGRSSRHASLERGLAAWLGHGDATLFSSGFSANVAVLSALGGPDTLIVSDALNHASIVDGCRLSRARVSVVPHASVDAVAAALRSAPEQRRVVVTDSYFSMDGDVAPLGDLRAVCDELGALLVVDEAHALGVFGPEGAGVAAREGVRADAVVGTFGKSFGGGGAFLVGSTALVDLVWNRGRALVFSTALAPTLVAKALWSFPRVRDGAATQALWQRTNLFRSALQEHGVAPARGSVGPIVPIPLGEARAATTAAARLRELGYVAHAMRPPTVPPGTSRLRCVVQAGHDSKALRRAAAAIGEVCR